MVLDSKRVSDIDLVSLVGFECLNLAYARELGKLIVVFCLVHGQVSLLELL